MIVLEIMLSENCPVAADRVRERLEPLVVDAIAEDLQERLAAYEEPDTGERANLIVKGNLRDGLEFAFNATSLDLVELVREQFARYGALAGTLSATVSGPSLEQLRFAFDGPRDLVAIIDRRLRKGPLGG